MLLGVVIARAFNLSGLEESSIYMQTISFMLAIGLYGSTFGIDLASARTHLRLLLTAVTVGVVLKAVLIGGSLWLAFDDPRYIILGVAVAQIDPLSVAALNRGNRMSPRAKTILSAWSSFDDPVTALLTIYATSVAVQLIDFGAVRSDFEPTSLETYFIALGLNVLLVLCAYSLWRYFRSRHDLSMAVAGTITVVAVDRFLMLGQALSGLFVRPDIGKALDRAISFAFATSAVMLGLVLAGGVDIERGVWLGIAAFEAQVVVGLLLTRGLPYSDRIHLAFAQQNGITAIILALLLEAQFDGIIAVVAPAIITVNVIHLVANTFVDRVLLPKPQRVGQGVSHG